MIVSRCETCNAIFFGDRCRGCSPCVIEGFRPQAESATTGCSAAGGGITPQNSVRSAGRAPCYTEVLDVIRAEFERASSEIEVCDAHRDQLFNLYKSISQRVAACFNEARR